MKVTQETKDRIQAEFPALMKSLGAVTAKKELARRYNVSNITVYRLVCMMIPKKEPKKRKESKFYNSREFIGSVMVPEAYRTRQTEINLSRVPVKNWEIEYNLAVN